MKCDDAITSIAIGECIVIGAWDTEMMTGKSIAAATANTIRQNSVSRICVFHHTVDAIAGAHENIIIRPCIDIAGCICANSIVV
jgi:hypothetical protein